MEGRVGGASSHAFIIRKPNPRAAESYQFMAGGSVATRCRSLSRADQAPAVGDAAEAPWVAVLGTTFLDSHDSFGYMHPEMGLSGHVHASA